MYSCCLPFPNQRLFCFCFLIFGKTNKVCSLLRSRRLGTDACSFRFKCQFSKITVKSIESKPVNPQRIFSWVKMPAKHMRYLQEVLPLKENLYYSQGNGDCIWDPTQKWCSVCTMASWNKWDSKCNLAPSLWTTAAKWININIL